MERITELLAPFLNAPALPSPGTLNGTQLEQVGTYLQLLLRWNQRMNLTSVRSQESIVTRHFGESFFLAACLGEADAVGVVKALDLGSGAGFPGLPLKIYYPDWQLTLVESNGKKAVFLKEVIRALHLSGVKVYAGRAEERAIQAPSGGLDLVTMRAAERFESAVATGADLLRRQTGITGGCLALLIGMEQTQRVPGLLRDFHWQSPVLIPESERKVVLIGKYPGGQDSEK
jgi:16S rRNA (guanine527-N7)-methyltransferase